MKPVFLIGYMGSGKSTLGKRLANKLGFSFIDLDKFIEKNEEKTISEIFQTQGENDFREIEKNALTKLSNQSNAVISTGGGTPCFFNNMDIMNHAGITVYLKMSTGALFNRLSNAKTERPLIKNLSEKELKEFIEKNVQARSAFYEKAQLIINGESAVLEEIIETLQLR